jgi:cardiolipin synthase
MAERRVLTIPNLISLIRLALVPVFLWLVFGAENIVGAGWMLALIGSTDWIDGYLARRLGQASKVGEFLDPLADRLAVAAAVIAGLVEGVLPDWLGWAVIVREGLIGIGAILVGVKVGAKLEVRRLGKLATLLLYTSVGWFYVSFNDFTPGLALAYLTGVPGVIAYYVVGVQYYGDARSMMARGSRNKVERDAG